MSQNKLTTGNINCQNQSDSATEIRNQDKLKKEPQAGTVVVDNETGTFRQHPMKTMQSGIDTEPENDADLPYFIARLIKSRNGHEDPDAKSRSSNFKLSANGRPSKNTRSGMNVSKTEKQNMTSSSQHLGVSFSETFPIQTQEECMEADK